MLFFGVGPDLPVGLNRVIGGGAARKGFIGGAISAFVVCTIGTGIAAALSGTLQGADRGRLYFVQDQWNILNYTLICPAYVGLSFALIAVAVKGHKPLREYATKLHGEFPRARRVRLPFWIAPLLCFAAAAVVTVQYMRESLDPTVYPRLPWWIESVDVGGGRLPGIVGSYYAIMNFTLLYVCLMGLLAFLSVAGMAVSVARGLSLQGPDSSVDWGSVSRIALPFIKTYVLAKLLAAVLMLNAYTWKFERPEGSFNIILMGAVLTFVGLSFVALPRYAIEYEWFKIKLRRARQRGELDAVEADDLRPHVVRVVVNVLDVLLIGGFAGTFFSGL